MYHFELQKCLALNRGEISKAPNIGYEAITIGQRTLSECVDLTLPDRLKRAGQVDTIANVKKQLRVQLLPFSKPHSLLHQVFILGTC